MLFRCRSAFFVVLIVYMVIGRNQSNAQERFQFITSEQGDLPIILSAPHGGRNEIPGAVKREGKGVKSFKTLTDTNTDYLAEKFADSIEKKFGKRPYLVIARFHRRYVDANRSPLNAYESEAAKVAYDEYHSAIVQARKEVTERWGHGILLDLHGQASEPKAIIRGTQNGKTAKHLVNRFGSDSLYGENSLFGGLAKQGFPVIPKVDSKELEHPNFDGGYIVRTYGSQTGGSIDAIQLEVGRELRVPWENNANADKLANALAVFTDVYLPEVKQAAKEESRMPGDSKKRVAGRPRANTNAKTIFFEDFSDLNRDGWFNIDNDASTLGVKTTDGKLSKQPELQFTCSEAEGLKSFVSHFPKTMLKKPGDSLSMKFDARHDNQSFVNKGFRFGFFNSNGTFIKSDGSNSQQRTSVDDDGYFVLLDLGSRTTFDSAVIRESINHKDARLWNGRTLASDNNGEAPDPLMFRKERRYTYELTLIRNKNDQVDLFLRNNVTGDAGALIGTSKLSPTLSFDTLYFGVNDSSADFAIGNVTVSHSDSTNSVSTNDKSRTKPIVVGVYQDEGAGASVIDLLFVLQQIENVVIKRLTAEEIRSGQLSEVDILIQPGGSGGGQGRHLGAEGREEIRSFVKAGGDFIGICAGAYLASSDYSWSLNILDAKVVDRQHWARGKGFVDISFSSVGKEVFEVKRQKMNILYAQGPLLAPGDHPEIEDYQEIATFETEIAKNGAPQGVMQGTTAIALGNFGLGQVICFSPHPELTQGLEQVVQAAIQHVRKIKN